MPELAIDLSSQRFWAFLLLAILIVVPIANARAKWRTLAALNIVFVGVVAGPRVVVGILIALTTLCVLLRWPVRPGRWLVVFGLGAIALSLFVFHKLALPDFKAFQLASTKAALSAIGYSYIFLRFLELLRNANEAAAKPSLPSLINYLLPFHMLAAGPIQSYDDFLEQPGLSQRLSLRESLDAFDRIVRGLFKKFVLAEALSSIFLTGFHQKGAYFCLETQIFYLWVYLDFSAYSDIAVGVGRLLGVATPENFNRPLLARNLIEFWERWHISLSQFIRRNLFIPIQVSLMRKYEGKHALAIASVAFSVSFVFCGLWHGLTVRFLVWGIMHALGLIVCNLYKHWLTNKLGRKGMKTYLEDRRIRVLSTLVTAEFVALSLAFVAYPFEGLRL